MLKSQTKLTALNAHIIIRSLATHSLGLDHVHVLMFAAYNLACCVLSQYRNLRNMEKYKLCSQKLTKHR